MAGKGTTVSRKNILETKILGYYFLKNNEINISDIKIKKNYTALIKDNRILKIYVILFGRESQNQEIESLINLHISPVINKIDGLESASVENIVKHINNIVSKGSLTQALSLVNSAENLEIIKSLMQKTENSKLEQLELTLFFSNSKNKIEQALCTINGDKAKIEYLEEKDKTDNIHKGKVVRSNKFIKLVLENISNNCEVLNSIFYIFIKDKTDSLNDDHLYYGTYLVETTSGISNGQCIFTKNKNLSISEKSLIHRQRLNADFDASIKLYKNEEPNCAVYKNYLYTGIADNTLDGEWVLYRYHRYDDNEIKLKIYFLSINGLDIELFTKDSSGLPSKYSGQIYKVPNSRHNSKYIFSVLMTKKQYYQKDELKNRAFLLQMNIVHPSEHNFEFALGYATFNNKRNKIISSKCFLGKLSATYPISSIAHLIGNNSPTNWEIYVQNAPTIVNIDAIQPDIRDVFSFEDSINGFKNWTSSNGEIENNFKKEYNLAKIQYDEAKKVFNEDLE
jgi:hypothetical protein